MPVRARWRAIRRDCCLLERPPLPLAVAFSFLFAAADAWAQLSGSLSAVSNYRYRGVSLSHNDPAAQATVVYDHPQGGYVGAFASTVKLYQPSQNEIQGIVFAGFAASTSAGLTFDVGLDYSRFTGPHSYAYTEIYAGVAYERVSARLYYAPRYYGRDASALYAEVNAAHRIGDRMLLLAHVGAFRNNGIDVYGNVPDYVFDARLGIGVDFDRFNVQLSWVGISSANAGYPVSGVRSRNGPVLSISWLF